MAQWYYARDNKQKLGPFSPVQLKELAATGELQPSDMLIRDGGRKWVSAASIKGLFAKAESANHPASSQTSLTSPSQETRSIRPDARVAEAQVCKTNKKSGWIAKAVVLLFLFMLGFAAGLFLEKREFMQRLAELDQQIQEGAEAKAALSQQRAESEQQLRQEANKRAESEQQLRQEASKRSESEQQLRQEASKRSESEQQLRQETSKTAALDTRLTESEQRVKEAMAATAALRNRLAESDQKVRDSATVEAALKRRLRLLSLANISCYALDQYALRTPKEAEESVESLAKYLVEPAENDREKVRSIFRWMTDRIAYDAEGFLAKRHGDNSAEGVLKNRKCVCAGYASLFESMCKQAGIEVASIDGYSKGYGYKSGDKVTEEKVTEEKITRPTHRWNAVKLDGKWRLVDVTWAAGHLEAEKFVKRFNESYYLTPPDEFIFNHLPTDSKWQLLENPVSVKEFEGLKKVGQDVHQFPGMSEEFRRRLQDGSFRGFVTVYSHPELTVLVHKAPLEKHLLHGAKHLFRVESADLAGMAVKNGDTWHPLTRNGNVFEGEVSVQKGALQVSGQIPQKGKVYWHILEYVVE